MLLIGSMKNLSEKFITTLSRGYLILFAVVGLVLVLVVFSRGNAPFEPKTPPVATANPEIKLVSVEPPAGPRWTIDSFTHTAFEFTSPVNPDLVVVRADPNIALRKTVYPGRPNVLYIEPQDKAWASGVNYTLTIVKGVIGFNNEELKEDIVYTFSNTPPEFIDLPGPI